ncbi:MAG TPA: hypothetical protein VIQ23_06130 [Hanamia sp.]
MKKLFAISFLFIYLFSTTELHQLLKAPLLIEHFMEHREENKDITLWQFLYAHYAGDYVKDADYDKDMKLPFKTHSNCVSSFSNVYLPSAKVSIEKPIQFLQKNSFVTKDQFLPTSFLSNIWQPPRIC